MIVNLLLVVLTLLRLAIGVSLLVTARRNKLPNLNWLAAFFLIQGVALRFAPAPANPLSYLQISLFLFALGFAPPQFPLIVFIQTTFYQARKNPLVWFMGLAVVGTVGAFYGVFTSRSNYDQSPWVAAYVPTIIAIWVWHGWLAYRALGKIAQDPAVDDWVKSRYRLVIAYAVTSILAVVVSSIRIVVAGGSAVSELGIVTAIISLVFQIASATLQFLAWVMPERFRRWLNRNQQTHEQEYIHQQALTILNVLGTAMSQGTGVTKMGSGIAIRTIIGKSINSQDNTLIEAHAVRMSYNEWQALLTNPELGGIIASTAENTNVANVLAKAEQALIAEQSLFTMQAK